MILGQISTGRLEVLEAFLKEYVNELGVVGIDNAFSFKKSAACTLFRKNDIIKKIDLPSLTTKNLWYSKFVFFPIYLLSLFSVLLCIVRLKRNCHLFIGIGVFPSLIGVILKKMRIVKNSIYYSLDYFPPQKNSLIENFFVRTIMILDRIIAKTSDVVWNISPEIPKAREKFGSLQQERYNHMIVPLCFSSKLLKNKNLDEIDRWSIAFVGTSGPFHGLDLLLDAMPLIIEKLPEIKVNIIGIGPWDDLKTKVSINGLDNYFVFQGFVENEETLFELVSKNAIGIAPYLSTWQNPAIYADPGKPKLYAFSGLPIVITNWVGVSKEIEKMKAGISINYDPKEFADAVVRLLKDDETLKEYRSNASKFAMSYTSEEIFKRALEKSIVSINTHGG